MEEQLPHTVPGAMPDTPVRKRENPFSSSTATTVESAGGEADSFQQPTQSETTSDTLEHKSDDDGNVVDGSSKSLPLIDINEFADRATEFSKRHVAQIAESNKLKLEELINHQKVLLESLEHENEKFTSSDCFSQMENMISKCRDYNAKLLRIRKFMGNITQRTTKIKKQCAKLHEAKAKALVEQEEIRRKEMERERLLVAQPIVSGTAEADDTES